MNICNINIIFLITLRFNKYLKKQPQRNVKIKCQQGACTVHINKRFSSINLSIIHWTETRETFINSVYRDKHPVLVTHICSKKKLC